MTRSIGDIGVGASGTKTWFRCLRPVDNPWMRLFWFPCAGASAVSYRLWLSCLPPGLEAYCLQMPGRSDRIREPAIADWAALTTPAADAIAPLVDRPYVVMGHSLGTLTAFEVLRELRRRGRRLPRRFVVAGRAAPHASRSTPRMGDLSDADLFEALSAYGGLPPEVREDAELVELIMPALRADVCLHEGYRYVEEPPLDCDIAALAGRLDADATSSDLGRWREQTDASFALHLFDGGHFFLHAECPAIVSLIVEGATSGLPEPPRTDMASGA